MKTRAAIACVFAVVLFAALAYRVPDVVDRPLNTPTPGAAGAPVPIAIPFAATAGTQTIRDLVVRVRDAAELEGYDAITLTFGTFGTSPELRYAWLQVAGSTCAFPAPQRTLRENESVLFTRTGSCGHTPPGPAPATLRLAFDGPARYARAAIWTAPPRPGIEPVLTIEASGQVLGVTGRSMLRRGKPAVSRIELLAFMWDLPVWQIASLVALGGALVAGGAAVAPGPHAARAAAASFSLAAGFCVSYAVVVPPLQAPDEPDHLLSFAKLTDRPELAAAESAWARRIHFYRMTFMADERFTSADRDAPFERDWPPEDVFAENVRIRSSTATRLWQGLAPIVPAHPPHALLFFRLVHALVFGAAFAGGAALLASGGAGTPPVLLAAVLLTLPSLPFFGMQMSESTFTLAAFILTGYCTLLLAAGATGRITGPMLGVAIALLAAGPRSGWPGLMIIVTLTVGRLLSRAAAPRDLADAAWFWGGLAAPALALFGTGVLWIPAPFYEQWHLTTFDPRGGLSSASFLLILTAGAAAGYLAEWVLRHLPAVTRVAGLAARGLCAIGAVWIAGTLIWSAWGTLPVLAVVERVPPASARDYAMSVLLPLVTAARIRGFDFLTWQTLWGGFGWADTILPSPAIAAATVTAAIAAIVALIAAARQREGTRALIATFGLAGLAAAAVAAAVGSYGLHRNVHGRYLVGAAVIGLCLLPAPALLAPGTRVPAAVRSAALLALACGLHAFALVFLLQKYFG